jgi:hypothetical protein
MNRSILQNITGKKKLRRASYYLISNLIDNQSIHIKNKKIQINIIITTRTASILDENVRINSKTKIH